MMACFGLSSSNFGAMAMEHMGSLAGTAASVQGAVVTIGGALLGLLFGQQFDGTTPPITLGFTLLCASALVIVLITEKSRLFRPQNIRASQPCQSGLLPTRNPHIEQRCLHFGHC